MITLTINIKGQIFDISDFGIQFTKDFQELRKNEIKVGDEYEIELFIEHLISLIKSIQHTDIFILYYVSYITYKLYSLSHNNKKTIKIRIYDE